MSYISSLKLHNFRCYAREQMSDLQPGFIVLSGPNGAGKTNVLEAVSFLSPGKGLRAAKVMEVQSRAAGQPWAVSGVIDNGVAAVQIGTGLDAVSEKRVVRVQGEAVRGQGALAEYMACVWLTPQMDRLFIDSSGHRRRFLDRLVFAFDPGHAGRVNRYENAMAQRSKLLREGRHDVSWLAALESQMAETGVAIAAARLQLTERLQFAAQSSLGKDCFPRAQLRVAGAIEALLEKAPALDVEEMFKYQLSESRSRDAITGGAASGPHKSDFSVVFAAKDMAADQCSTGEQKALLIGILLAHARLIASERGAPPVLLLDEVAAHLDEDRRATLYGILQDLGAQVWLTGTDESLFQPLKNRAQFFHVQNAQIIPDMLPLAIRSA